MRILLHIIRKEFIQIFRNKAILPMMTLLPIIQLILLSYAADNEVKNVNLALVDMDRSQLSGRLEARIRNSDRFVMAAYPDQSSQGIELMQEGSVDIVLTIPQGFQRDLFKTGITDNQLLVNAINGQQATVGAAYLNQIIQLFSNEIREEEGMQLVINSQQAVFKPLETRVSYWYNEQLNFKHFMVPGILGELVTILVMMLTAMNIVREREIGTIEQINVTPIKKWQFILGKLIPFLFVGIGLLIVGLIAGKLIFDVPMRGNLLIIFAYCIINLSAVLGLGLFISNLSDTQQQAMFTTFFFVIIFILMSGLFTPIDSMPKWAQYMTIPNPIAHFVYVMRAVLLKGSGFWEVVWQFRITCILAVVFNGLAIMTYKKVS